MLIKNDSIALEGQSILSIFTRVNTTSPCQVSCHEITRKYESPNYLVKRPLYLNKEPQTDQVDSVDGGQSSKTTVKFQEEDQRTYDKDGQTEAAV